MGAEEAIAIVGGAGLALTGLALGLTWNDSRADYLPMLLLGPACGLLAVLGLDLGQGLVAAGAEGLFGFGCGGLLAAVVRRRRARSIAAPPKPEAFSDLSVLWFERTTLLEGERDKLRTRCQQMTAPITKLEALLSQPLPEAIAQDAREKAAVARMELEQLEAALQNFELLLLEQTLQGIHESLINELQAHVDGRRPLVEVELRRLMTRWTAVIDHLRDAQLPRFMSRRGMVHIDWAPLTARVTQIRPGAAEIWLEGQQHWARARREALERAVNACLAQQHIAAIDRASAGEALLLDHLVDLRLAPSGAGPELVHELEKLELDSDTGTPALMVLRAVEQFRMKHGTSKAWVAGGDRADERPGRDDLA